MGERDHYISLEMASIGMEMVAAWGTDAIIERLRMLTDRLADGLRNSGVLVPDRVRAPHILSLQFPDGMPERPGRSARGGERVTSRRASAACASARTSTTTRRTSIASWRPSGASPAERTSLIEE